MGINVLLYSNHFNILKNITYPIVASLLLSGNLNAQTIINGLIKDNYSQEALAEVQIENIHTKEKVVSDSNGRFKLTVKSDELLVLNKENYQITRQRIVNERSPLFYEISLKRIRLKLAAQSSLTAYQKDSIKNYKRYAIALNGTNKGEFNRNGNLLSISFDGLSKHNKDRWAFKATYKKWENEKYIDSVFNKKQVVKMTSLEGEDLKRFMKLFRPTYRFMREATTYEFLDYIKKSYKKFIKLQKY